MHDSVFSSAIELLVLSILVFVSVLHLQIMLGNNTCTFCLPTSDFDSSCSVVLG